MNSSDLFDRENICSKLYIRYMLSSRCKTIVKEVLGEMNINYELSIHGGLCFPDGITRNQQSELRENLKKHGLELLKENESNLIERIVNEIITMIHFKDELPKLSFAEVLNVNLNSEEKSIFSIFSDVMGMSVIQFIVMNKVDRVKELLLYEDLPLSEISNMLCYKNEKKLIAQFKKHTGLTPAYFKELKQQRIKIASQSSKYSSVKQ